MNAEDQRKQRGKGEAGNAGAWLPTAPLSAPGSCHDPRVPERIMTTTTFCPRGPGLLRRNELYLEILKLGLSRIRGTGYHGDHRYCEIEADHLHNIPGYVAGGDGANHLYYLTKEVRWYLSRLDLKIAACSDLVWRYVPLWQELETRVPVEGSPWEQEWRAIKAGGWNYGLPPDETAREKKGRS
jgi:hypothetical protein